MVWIFIHFKKYGFFYVFFFIISNFSHIAAYQFYLIKLYVQFSYECVRFCTFHLIETLVDTYFMFLSVRPAMKTYLRLLFVVSNTVYSHYTFIIHSIADGIYTPNTLPSTPKHPSIRLIFSFRILFSIHYLLKWNTLTHTQHSVNRVHLKGYQVCTYC